MAFCRLLKRKKLIFAAVLGLLAACLFCFSSCVDEREKVDFTALSDSELSKYGELGQYTGMTVELEEGQSKEEAVWARVVENMTLGEEAAPEQIQYYMAQIEEEYRFHAKKLGISYEEVLVQMGVHEGDIFKEAEALTQKDIAYALVRSAEGIEITDAEKESFFSKYAEKYARDYGQTPEYVEQNMSDLIYASMLYDKTTEFLIVNNTFIKE